jgi:hypothetical protein
MQSQLQLTWILISFFELSLISGRKSGTQLCPPTRFTVVWWMQIAPMTRCLPPKPEDPATIDFVARACRCTGFNITRDAFLPLLSKRVIYPYQNE